MRVTVTNSDLSYALVAQTARADNPSNVLSNPHVLAPGESVDLQPGEGEMVLVTRGAKVIHQPSAGEQQSVEAAADRPRRKR